MKSVNKWFISLGFSVLHAIALSVGIYCFLDVFSGFLVAAVFDEPLLANYPRYVPFCIVVGLLALIAFILICWLNTKLFKKHSFTKPMLVVEAIVTLALTVPLVMVWADFFAYLHKIF
ncbi:MAG: hypothetical protein IKU25_01325 [Clostridia bacterium]|nr:hypothetical protein [Clostridia bacterium]